MVTVGLQLHYDGTLKHKVLLHIDALEDYSLLESLQETLHHENPSKLKPVGVHGLLPSHV